MVNSFPTLILTLLNVYAGSLTGGLDDDGAIKSPYTLALYITFSIINTLLYASWKYNLNRSGTKRLQQEGMEAVRTIQIPDIEQGQNNTSINDSSS